MPGGVTVDGFDLADIGFTVGSDLTGWRDSIAALHRSRQMSGRISETRLSAQKTGRGRQIVVRGFQKADDVATLIGYLDELKYRLNRPDSIQIETDDRPGYHFLARMDGRVEVTGIQPSFIQPRHRVTFPLVCEDPRLYEDTEQEITVLSGSGDVEMPLGTAPVEPEIEVDVASFTLTYKDSAGNVVATLEISGASATPVTIDMQKQTIVSASGSEIDALESGDFFELDPQHGDYATDTWPTLDVDSAAEATVRYHKAFL